MVRDTWPTAWNVNPKESRLMHGVGLRAMAIYLVNRLEGLYQQYGQLESGAVWDDLGVSLKRLQPLLVWRFEDSGDALKQTQAFYTKEIRDAQNTSQDIVQLAKEIKKLSLNADAEAKTGKGKK